MKPTIYLPLALLAFLLTAAPAAYACQLVCFTTAGPPRNPFDGTIDVNAANTACNAAQSGFKFPKSAAILSNMANAGAGIATGTRISRCLSYDTSVPEKVKSDCSGGVDAEASTFTSSGSAIYNNRILCCNM